MRRRTKFASPQWSVSLQRDVRFINVLESIINWCASRGVRVTFDNQPNGSYDRDSKDIYVNARMNPENQAYVLLHECGHHLIGPKPPGSRFESGGVQGDLETKKSILQRIDVIDEELEAWYRGLKLAKRLGLWVDVKRYNQARARYVRTYLKWALRSNTDEGKSRK